MRLLYCHCQQFYETENLKQRQLYSEHSASFLGESLSGHVVWHSLMLNSISLTLLVRYYFPRNKGSSASQPYSSSMTVSKTWRCSNSVEKHAKSQGSFQHHSVSLYASTSETWLTQPLFAPVSLCLHWAENLHVISGFGEEWDCFRVQIVF